MSMNDPRRASPAQMQVSIGGKRSKLQAAHSKEAASQATHLAVRKRAVRTMTSRREEASGSLPAQHDEDYKVVE
jgi:hypothetical protein